MSDIDCNNIYSQHDNAFRHVSAFVILNRHSDIIPTRVATVAIKFPKDGAGRLYAYVHWFGLPMVRGSATGGGYDKRSAACASAASKMPDGDDSQSAFRLALLKDDGNDWTRNLTDAGFTVLQAV